MALVINSDYQSHVYNLLVKEMREIGIHVTSYTVKYDNEVNNSFFNRARNMIAQFEFTCNEDQIEYMRPFAYIVNAEHKIKPPPVELFTEYGPVRLPDSLPKIEVEKEYRCVMMLTLTGGTMDNFLAQFREQTEKLRYAAYSKNFDEEVEDALTDEYNK